ncbi:MAG: tRNA preQ1(34) S-adenosylmethionine ribosyltransferase-isomerase QueA [Verrucomicrobia bacterium]|nr:tRNA preQ1(34) S-adenosylmethionine ribosyltransferase-isomerase QueA [Verrucomicrobiota bacterium]MBU1909608.1 tRNA preQ1(34) S-adenosylmethionine ribosyltransferase-isomerase QueA [Verrucomicrobiota bacterium]
MRTQDFDYKLPPERIAQLPAERRDDARMLVVERRTGLLRHQRVQDLPVFLRPGDLLVANNTRVIPARLFGAKPTGGKVEILFLEEREPGVWEVLMHAARRPKIGDVIRLGDGAARALLLADGEKGRAVLRVEGAEVLDLLDRFGLPPLPPYIRRPARRGVDDHRYQTIYAEHPGAVAAPTAGLHFTPELLARLQAAGIPMAFVTLHVGLGTFRPVSAEHVEDHRMEAERYIVPGDTARRIEETRGHGGRIVAVGTTTVRTLESVAAEHGRVVPTAGRTALFIRPPFEFRATDALLTNFHLPRSTLLMLVCAFAGRDLVLHAYREAVEQGYRFYSYGDCMLLV